MAEKKGILDKISLLETKIALLKQQLRLYKELAKELYGTDDIPLDKKHETN